MLAGPAGDGSCEVRGRHRKHDDCRRPRVARSRKDVRRTGPSPSRRLNRTGCHPAPPASGSRRPDPCAPETLFKPGSLTSTVSIGAVWTIASVAPARKHPHDISKKLDRISDQLEDIGRFQKEERLSNFAEPRRGYLCVTSSLRSPLLKLIESIPRSRAKRSRPVTNRRTIGAIAATGERDCPATRERTGPRLHPAVASARGRRDTARRDTQVPASRDCQVRYRPGVLSSSPGLRTMGSLHGYHKLT